MENTNEGDGLKVILGEYFEQEVATPGDEAKKKIKRRVDNGDDTDMEG